MYTVNCLQHFYTISVLWLQVQISFIEPHGNPSHALQWNHNELMQKSKIKLSSLGACSMQECKSKDGKMNAPNHCLIGKNVGFKDRNG